VTAPFLTQWSPFLNWGGLEQIQQGRLLKSILVAALFVFATSGIAHPQSVGQASYYSYPRYSGFIAAHRTLPFGTHVKVTNLANGRTATVVVVDRGPFIRSRIIDVSTNAANVLGFRQAGVARVKIEVVDR
jgi:peptidoglycan lytic transglycosylase